MNNSKIPLDEGKQIDDLFRNALGDHTVEPPGNLWNGISRKLFWKEISRLNFSNVSTGYRIAGTAVIALIVGLLIFYPGKQNTGVLNSSPEKVTSARIHSGSQPVPSYSTVQSGKNSVPVIQHTALSALNKPGITGKPQMIAAVSRPVPNPVRSNLETRTSMESISSVLNSSASQERWSLLAFNSLNVDGINLDNRDDTVITFNTLQGIMNVKKVKPGMLQSFSTDFGVTPEWVKYNNTRSYSEMNYWLNAKIGYHFSKFSIQTGVALGYVFDEGKYNTKYLSKDSIGYFTSVISFYLDPANQNQLVFNTKDVAVYDSMQHFADDRTRNRYTYLEFPLLFGYQIFETNKLSLDIMAGPSLSLLIGTRLAQPYVDFPNARIIRIDDNTPQRVKTNWKIALSLHLEYRVTKNLGCYLEPSYKYYINSFTEKEQTSTKEPYSIGIGLGIRYHFGQIKK